MIFCPIFFSFFREFLESILILIFEREMNVTLVERDENGKESYSVVDAKYIPTRSQWNKHINNLVEKGLMEEARKL